jgi:hypothetical protein
MTVTAEQVLKQLHAAKEARDPARFRALLADEITVNTPRFFRPVTSPEHFVAIMMGILEMLPDFDWYRQWLQEGEVLLEFKGHVAGGKILAHGIELFEFGADGRIHTATIWIRPLSALEALAEGEDRKVAGILAALERSTDGAS